MINLLPDVTKKELSAARVNTLLARYIGIIFLAFVFLVFILAGSYYLLDLTRQSSMELIESNDTKAEVYSTTKTQIDALSMQLQGAKGILDQEVLYSNILINFAQLMPAGTIIDKMTLEPSSFGTSPMTLTVYAKSTENAVALRDTFQNSPLFTNVNFQNIADASTGGPAGYPVSATMTLTLNRTAAQ